MVVPGNAAPLAFGSTIVAPIIDKIKSIVLAIAKVLLFKLRIFYSPLIAGRITISCWTKSCILPTL
jgi:hypothetical protein